MKIAILLTCFNRKKLTLNCLNSLYQALSFINNKIDFSIYLTDDGSTDGTSLAIMESYPEVNLLSGNGHLYWAGGMRNSWNEALKGDYDGYLLLNDDTYVFNNLIEEIEKGIDYCISNHNKNGILIGSTKDEITGEHTYGGSVYTNQFKATYSKLIPSMNYQYCQLGNGNIMFVHKDVVDEIGILSKGYTHGVADYDYTLSAYQTKIPVVVLPNYLGYCSANIHNKSETFLNLKSIKERYNYLFSPTGLALRDNLSFQRKFFPIRFYFVLMAAYLKILIPRVYIWFNKIRMK